MAAKPVVIVRDSNRLSDDEIVSLLKGTHKSPWWRAIKQIALDDMNASVLAESAAAEQNNPLRMATESGGYAAISGLIAKLSDLVGEKRS